MKCCRCRTWDAIFSVAKGKAYEYVCSDLTCLTENDRKQIDKERKRRNMCRIEDMKQPEKEAESNVECVTSS